MKAKVMPDGRRGEPGEEKVKAALDGALLSAVNLAEIVSYYAKLGADRCAAIL